MAHQQNPDKLTQINISITLGVGLTSFVLSMILVGVYAVKKDYRDTLNFLVTTLATSAGITSAVYALRSIKQSAESQELDRKQNIQNSQIDRSLYYIREWNKPEYLSIRKRAKIIHNEIIKQTSDKQKKFLLDYLEAHPNEEQEIINVLNFLEEMALCVEQNIIDEQLIRLFYRFIVIRYCNTFKPLINKRRGEADNDKLFKKFTDLADKWKNFE